MYKRILQWGFQLINVLFPKIIVKLILYILLCGYFKNKMTVLLVRGPHKIWPMTTEADNFFPPLNLLALAAWLEQEGEKVRFIDCFPNKWGFKTLKKAIAMINPDVIGVAGPITWANESYRILEVAKEVNKDILTVAGGSHFPHTADYYMIDNPKTSIEFRNHKSDLDLIVYGEGELTLTEIVKEYRKSGNDFSKMNLKEIRGIMYNQNNSIHVTEPRPMIKDLDTLPYPAYHLTNLKRYAKKERAIFGGGASEHHSRGCPGQCSFCSCRITMSDPVIEGNQFIKFNPRYRTMSGKRTVEIMKWLEDDYKIDYHLFVDDCWNSSPKFVKEFAKEYQEAGLKRDWFAFMRADSILRDWKNGTLKELYKTNPAHWIIGAERKTNADIKYLNKKGYSTDATSLVFKILEQENPYIFRHATMLNGVWDDTKETIVNTAKWIRGLNVDYPSYALLTPHPGTELHRFYKEQGLITTDDYGVYDWFTPIVRTKYLDHRQLADANMLANFIVIADPLWYLKGMFNKNKRKKFNYWWFTKQILVNTARRVFRIENPYKETRVRDITGYKAMVTPWWYER